MINKILEKFRQKFFFLDNLKVTYFHGDSVKQAKKLEHLCKTVTKDMEDFLRQSIVEVLKKLREDIAENRPINMREEITHNTYSDGKRDLADKLLSTITSEIESIK